MLYSPRFLKLISYQLYAFERDQKRFSTLRSMLSKAGCTNVEPINADFLSADPLDPKYAGVTHMYGAHFTESQFT